MTMRHLFHQVGGVYCPACGRLLVSLDQGERPANGQRAVCANCYLAFLVFPVTSPALEIEYPSTIAPSPINGR